MAFEATAYNVMIASPSDTAAECKRVISALLQWNLEHSSEYGVVFLPRHWKTDAAPVHGVHPQHAINEQVLDKCDVLIGILYWSLGSATPESDSATVGEIERHFAAGKLAMLYFAKAKIPP